MNTIAVILDCPATWWAFVIAGFAAACKFDTHKNGPR